MTAHDREKLTFREIGEILGIAPSWVFKLYRKGKSNAG